jgi:hypothetical protein
MCRGQEGLYHVIREGITGGLSNVHFRENIKGETHIKKLWYNKDTNEIEVFTNHDYVISHCICLDGNSLYPSSYSSVQHPCNPYTDGIMYMPGPVKFRSTDKNVALAIILQKQELFLCVLKGHIPSYKYNEPTPGACSPSATVLNFPPIFGKVDITTDRKTIGEPMYNYMKASGIPTDRQERKLTQLLDTNDQFMAFGSYYLWFLMDYCYFVIDEIQEIYVFEKNRAFNKFATEFMGKRIETTNDAENAFYKLNLNGSYGYDGMNEENFTKSKIMNKQQTALKQLTPNFVGSKMIDENTYQVESVPKFFGCDTCLIEAFYTLNNAKFWFLNVIYNFMYKCLDMRLMQFVEGDTDSMYWAIAGAFGLTDPFRDKSSKNKVIMDVDIDSYGKIIETPIDNKQAFKYVIKDEQFYNENVYKWFPSGFFSTDNSNPTFPDKISQKKFDKKLLGFAIEKESDCVVALAPKVYIPFNRDGASVKDGGPRVKGVKLSQNPLSAQCYMGAVTNPC